MKIHTAMRKRPRKKLPNSNAVGKRTTAPNVFIDRTMFSQFTHTSTAKISADTLALTTGPINGGGGRGEMMDACVDAFYSSGTYV
jgi:hypothetical protein